jgi:hypothetical protein
MNSSEENNLRETLGKWKVDRPLPAGFQNRVWNSIARAEEKGPEGFWQSFPSWVENVFARQTVALIYVVALLILGLTAGYASGKARERQLNSRLAASYLDTVDPNQKPPF